MLISLPIVSALVLQSSNEDILSNTAGALLGNAAAIILGPVSGILLKPLLDRITNNYVHQGAKFCFSGLVGAAGGEIMSKAIEFDPNNVSIFSLNSVICAAIGTSINFSFYLAEKEKGEQAHGYHALV